MVCSSLYPKRAPKFSERSKSTGFGLEKLRVYLKEKYNVSTAYLFIGFMQTNQDLYSMLQKAGYILIFKPIILDGDGKAKGNCDADLVLHTILEKDNYDKEAY